MCYDVVIAHHIPGRLRLRVVGAKRNSELLKRIAKAITAIEGVRDMEINPLTGSVVLRYKRESGPFLRDLASAGLRFCNHRFTYPGIFDSDAREAKGRPRWRKITRRSLLALGVAGVLLPIVPGTPFLIAGAAILGLDDPIVRRGKKFLGYMASGTSERRG